MTKMQNFQMQGCTKVLCELADKLSVLSSGRIGNLPSPILANLRRIYATCVNLMDEVSTYAVTDEYIARLRQRLGDLACNVAMIEIQIDAYKKGQLS